jgi:hypothetical protein
MSEVASPDLSKPKNSTKYRRPSKKFVPNPDSDIVQGAKAIAALINVP